MGKFDWARAGATGLGILSKSMIDESEAQADQARWQQRDDQRFEQSRQLEDQRNANDIARDQEKARLEEEAESNQEIANYIATTSDPAVPSDKPKLGTTIAGIAQDEITKNPKKTVMQYVVGQNPTKGYEDTLDGKGTKEDGLVALDSTVVRVQQETGMSYKASLSAVAKAYRLKQKNLDELSSWKAKEDYKHSQSKDLASFNTDENLRQKEGEEETGYKWDEKREKTGVGTKRKDGKIILPPDIEKQNEQDENEIKASDEIIKEANKRLINPGKVKLKPEEELKLNKLVNDNQYRKLSLRKNINSRTKSVTSQAAKRTDIEPAPKGARMGTDPATGRRVWSTDGGKTIHYAN